MKMRLKKKVHVELVGGLGNQLFQFFAAKYVSDRENCELVLSSNRIGYLESDHGYHLSNLVQCHDYASKQYRFPKIMAHTSKVIEKIQRRFMPPALVQYLFKTYNSTVIGYDSKLEVLAPSVTLRGYFQTYRYFSSNTEYKKMVRIENPSRWCREMQSDMESHYSVSIHVRYGDYAALKLIFGVLDENYYKRAVSIADELKSNATYFVFSDDLDWARRVLAFLPESKTVFVLPPPESNPSESMYLMSLSDCLIGANSTFSYWSGLLAGSDSVVITPEKWFRNLEDPSDLCPLSWIRCESSWIN
jgi:hypothetical protein